MLAIAFHLNVIWHAVWLYLKFTLGYRDVEDLLTRDAIEMRR
jgi:transposase-like protein